MIKGYHGFLVAYSLANVQQDSFSTYGASMHWLSPESNFTISLIGKNLTEEKILAWGIPSGPNILAAMAPPREIALSVKYRF
jgi:iron complex outermembrane receptor protein